MSLWEYKVISSGKGGFATPALLEKFLNDLGRDEWEILEFRTAPDNALAFSGLARRSTQRDWTLQDAAAAAAKAEAEKLRAEFEAKFKAATTAPAGAAGEERTPSFLEEKVAPDDGFRKPIDTSHDAEPDDEEEAKADEWDKMIAAEEDELPTFFEAIRPHMRKNQRGPGMSVGVDYLAKKWDQSEEDIRGALAECGFVVPEDEDAKVEYLEYDGDLYWLNVNRRGELWINTKEKPRPVFRAVKAQKIAVEEEPKPDRRQERGERSQPAGDRAKTEEAAARPEGATGEGAATEGEGQPAGAKSEGAPAKAGAPLPEGPALLDKIRPHMRRNRRGPGGSGSTSFLSRALKCNEAELKAAFQTLGLVVPGSANEKPVHVEFNDEIWWLNADSRGGIWINGREKKPGETAAQANAEQAPLESAAPTPGPETPPPVDAGSEAGANQRTAAEPPSAAEASSAEAQRSGDTGRVLAAVRLLLKETKTGAIAAKVERVAEEMGKPVDDFVATLVGAGLKVPEKSREKPVFVEHAGEIFWLNRNAKDELWLNAKASKFGEQKAGDEPAAPAANGDETGEPGEADKKSRSRGGRGRKKSE